MIGFYCEEYTKIILSCSILSLKQAILSAYLLISESIRVSMICQSEASPKILVNLFLSLFLKLTHARLFAFFFILILCYISLNGILWYRFGLLSKSTPNE